MVETAAALGGFVNLLNSIFTNEFNRENIESTNDTNRYLAKYSYDQQRQMIKEQNEYNSPLQQMKRYEDAGLNPNLIYGNGSSSAGNQSQIAQYHAPDIRPFQVGSLGVDEAINSAIQIAIMEADLKKKNNESYAAQMLGSKYEQEGYSEWLRNMYDSVLLGLEPGIIHQPGEVDKIKSSLKLRSYNANVESVEAGASLKRSQESLIKVNEKVQSMSLKAQTYYYENIQPLLVDIMKKKALGLDIQNDLLTLQRKFYQADKYFHYGTQLLNEIFNGIRTFSPTSSPSYPNSPSWYGSPTYPSESYVPGL